MENRIRLKKNNLTEKTPDEDDTQDLISSKHYLWQNPPFGCDGMTFVQNSQTNLPTSNTQ